MVGLSFLKKTKGGEIYSTHHVVFRLQFWILLHFMINYVNKLARSAQDVEEDFHHCCCCTRLWMI